MESIAVFKLIASVHTISKDGFNEVASFCKSNDCKQSLYFCFHVYEAKAQDRASLRECIVHRVVLGYWPFLQTTPMLKRKQDL